MKLTTKLILLGTFMCFSAIWAGAYAIHLSDDKWWNFPAFLTTAIFFFVGYGLISYAYIERND